MKHYTYIVIGSGGGTKITHALDQLGVATALIEKDQAGGTCLNRGCIPSKLLIHPAGLVQRLRNLRHLQIDSDVRGLDFEALVASINAYTDETSGRIDQRYEQAEHVDFYRGEAVFKADRVLRVGDYELSADRIVIATGSRPMIPDIPGLAGTPYMTSTEALRNRVLPPRLIVIGGGYIAAELGGAYAGFGSEVRMVIRSSLLRREDPEVVDAFRSAFNRHVTLHEHTSVERVEWRDGVFRVVVHPRAGAPHTLEAEALLVATGVTPNADRLGLEHTGIARDADGFIAVDGCLRTSVPDVFAIGDVAGNFLFRHSVNFEGEYFVRSHVLADTPFPIDYPPMPSAVFTHPEIASVGLTEEAARAQGLDIVIGRAGYASCVMAVARGLKHGMVKLVFERSGGKLVGAHIVGEEASTMIQELVLAATTGLTAEDIYRQVYIHPAFPEVVRNAVRDALVQRDPSWRLLF